MGKNQKQLIKGYDKMDRLTKTFNDAQDTNELIERIQTRRIIERNRLSEADYLRIKKAPQK
jgi:hypothetical protein